MRPDEVPSIDEILQAHGTNRIALLIAWLDVADADALETMAEALERDLGRFATESSAELFFSLFLQRGFTLVPEETLARAERWRKQEQALTRILRDNTLFILWAQVDPEGTWTEARSRSVTLAGAVIEGIQKGDPWRAYQ